MPKARIFLAVASCAVMAACAAKPPPPPPAPAPAPDPAGSVDGEYWGTSTRFQADMRKCPHPGLVKFTVFDGQFEYRWDYRTYVQSSIDPQNEVHGSAENITLVGRRNGQRIEGDVTDGYCGLHFTVRKRKS